MQKKTVFVLATLSFLTAGAVLAASGIVTGKGTSSYSQVEACASAKQDARRAAQSTRLDSLDPVSITRFEPCMCEQDENSGFWSCIVDAHYKFEDAQ